MIFDYFASADVQVERTTYDRSAGGGPKTTQVIAEGRGDPQQHTETLERYAEADVIVFCDFDLSGVQTGDEVTAEPGEGEPIQGVVEQVRHIDDALLLSVE
jgi:hypothetical protein